MDRYDENGQLIVYPPFANVIRSQSDMGCAQALQIALRALALSHSDNHYTEAEYLEARIYIADMLDQRGMSVNALEPEGVTLTSNVDVWVRG